MMSDVRRLTLTDKLGFIDSTILPAIGGCNFLCLSDRQVDIVRRFVFPFARWPTRYVLPVGRNWYETDPTAYADLLEEVDDLDLQINGGSTMSCQTIAEALEALAEAMVTWGGGGGGSSVTNVYCGGGQYAGVAGELANYTNEQLLPPEDVEEPEPGTPPDGFETWDEYLEYKCQAAHFVWAQMRALAGINSGLAGLQVTAAVAAPLIAGLLGAWPVALTPAGFVALVAGVVAVAAINIYAYLAFTQWIQWWDDNKDMIVCELYLSATAASAMSALADFIEDGIQAVVWTGLLSGLEAATAPIMGSILGEVVTNSFVGPLFRLVEVIAMPGVECPCAPLEDEWHFDAWAEYWTFERYGDEAVGVVGLWNAEPASYDPGDTSHGALQVELTPPGSGELAEAGGHWTYTFPPSERPIAANGFGLRCDIHAAVYDVEYRIQIYYTDDEEDGAWGNTNVWKTETIYCDSANWGKDIDHIVLTGYNPANHHVAGTVTFDKVYCKQF